MSEYLTYEEYKRRDTPRKVKIEIGMESDVYACPECDADVLPGAWRDYENFCPVCGQRLDWRGIYSLAAPCP